MQAQRPSTTYRSALCSASNAGTEGVLNHDDAAAAISSIKEVEERLDSAEGTKLNRRSDEDNGTNRNSPHSGEEEVEQQQQSNNRGQTGEQTDSVRAGEKVNETDMAKPKSDDTMNQTSSSSCHLSSRSDVRPQALRDRNERRPCKAAAS